MPRYRIKSGKIHLGRGRNRRRFVPNEVVNFTVETATKFKDQLHPMDPDSIFVDDFTEHSMLMDRENPLTILKIEGQPGFFNVLNRITNSYVNDSPLNQHQAMDLCRGANLEPVFSEEGTQVEEKVFKEKEEVVEDNDDNDNDDEEETLLDVFERMKNKGKETKKKDYYQLIKDHKLTKKMPKGYKEFKKDKLLKELKKIIKKGS